MLAVNFKNSRTRIDNAKLSVCSIEELWGIIMQEISVAPLSTKFIFKATFDITSYKYVLT